jgi:transcriptional regulator PpsR
LYAALERQYDVKQFSAAQRWLVDIHPDVAAQLITAAADVALVISGEQGLIRDVSFGSEELAREIDGQTWVGRPWLQTVTAESRPKIEALLRDAAARAAPRWRQVNHRRDGADDLPVMYAAIPVGDRVVAVGRSLRPIATLQQRLLEAQQAMEREYSRLRQTETRHRLLFQVASEAVLIVDASTRRVIEANPAAVEMIEAAGGRRLVGETFPNGFEPSGVRAIEELLGTVRATGRTESARARADGGREFSVAVSLFREDSSTFFLVRLQLARSASAEPALPKTAVRVMDAVEGGPDAFLVTDSDGRVQFANRAFLDMAQLATPEQVRGEPLERWLGRPGVDFNLLAAHLREHGTLRLFATTVRGEYGSTTDVEICAVAVPDSGQPALGFTIRDVGQRLTTERRIARDRPRSVEQLTELVGRVPLKDLVRESSDMIERLCIEAALTITNDNRASAAEILGLSRQSLYAKLRRHGLGDLDAQDEAPAEGKGVDDADRPTPRA